MYWYLEIRTCMQSPCLSENHYLTTTNEVGTYPMDHGVVGMVNLSLTHACNDYILGRIFHFLHNTGQELHLSGMKFTLLINVPQKKVLLASKMHAIILYLRPSLHISYTVGFGNTHFVQSIIIQWTWGMHDVS